MKLAEKKGFTLIELLVVVAIIVLLLSILLPSLRTVKEHGKSLKCMANLKNIGLGTLLFSNDYDQQIILASASAKAFGPTFIPGGPLWEDPGTTVPYTPLDMPGLAYWGVLYSDFVDNKNAYACPSALPGFADGEWHTDDWLPIMPLGYPDNLEEAFYKYVKYATYGLNPYFHISGYREFKRDEYRNPSETIFTQDHYEQRPDAGLGGDFTRTDAANDLLVSSARDGGRNLEQWRSKPPNTVYLNAITGVYRHYNNALRNNGDEVLDGKNNIVWLDGHVSSINESLGQDVPPRWYDGSTGRDEVRISQ